MFSKASNLIMFFAMTFMYFNSVTCAIFEVDIFPYYYS